MHRVADLASAEPRRALRGLDETRLQIRVRLLVLGDVVARRSRSTEPLRDPRAAQLVLDHPTRNPERRTRLGDRGEISTARAVEPGSDDRTLRGEDLALRDTREPPLEHPRVRVRERELGIARQRLDRVDRLPRHRANAVDPAPDRSRQAQLSFRP